MPSPTTQGLAAQLATMTPNSALLARQNSDLADMLAQERQPTPITGGWGQLAAQLAATGITTFAKHKSDQALINGVLGERKAYGDSLLSHLTPQAPAAPADPTAAAPPTPAPSAAAAALAAPAPAPVAASAPPSGGLDPDLVRMVAGEARGESPTGQQAAAAVAMNRAKASGMSLHDVVTAPHQFDGYPGFAGLQPTDSLFQKVAANIAPLVSGQAPDPTNGADHFYAPHGMAGGKPPAWDNGTGTDIGNQRFLHLGYSAPHGYQPQPQGQAPMQPFQVASNGPLTPQMMPGGPQQPPAPMPPAPVPSGPQGGGAPAVTPPSPAGAPTLPTGPGATPQELSMVREYLQSPNPQIYAQGVAMAQDIQKRAASPVELEKGYAYGPGGVVRKLEPDTGYSFGPDGKMVSNHPLQDVGSTPNQFVQRGDDNSVHVTDNKAYGPVPTGMGMTAGGALTPLQQPQFQSVGAGGGAPAKGGLAPIGSLIQRDPTTGEVKADPRLAHVTSISDEALHSPEVVEYAKLSHAFGGITTALQNAVKNNGSLDTSFVDATGQVINPGRAMTVGSTKLWLQHYGLPEELAGHVASIFGNGYITPKTMNDGLSVMSSYANSAHDQATSRLGKASQALSGFGVQDPRLAVDGVPAIPKVSWLNGGQPNGSGAGGSGGAVAGGMPRPGSPQEAMALPPGTRFVDPSGKVRIR